MTPRGERMLRAAFPWAVLAAFCAYFFGPQFPHLAWVHWDVPSGSDALAQGAIIKSMIETGWVFTNPRLGAPFGTELFDFPGADGALLLVLKLLALFSSDPAVVMNLFYVASFGMVFAASYWVLRRFAIGVPWAAAASLLYACLPYHFLRGYNHLYLANYFVVPLLVWAALAIYPGERALPPTVPARWRWSWPWLLLLLCGGSAGIYYAVFGMMLLLFAGLLGAWTEKQPLHLLRAGAAAAVVALGVLLNLAPSIAYVASDGSNPEVAVRLPIESELYGLKAAQMLLPTPGHHVPRLANLTQTYQQQVQQTEASASALGIVASLGFLVLCAVGLFGNVDGADKRLATIARMNLLLFAFAAVGGFAVLFAMGVTPQFRGTNRASICIAFLSLLGLFLWLRNGPPAWSRQVARTPWLPYLLAFGLAVAGLYDQIPSGARVLAPQAKDAALPQYLRQVEQRIPRGGMVYVLPYVSFPESPPAFEEGYNGLLRLYYYSSHARWSYGAMRGRAGDAWLRSVESLPLAQRIDALQQTGFAGIHVERKAFKDHGAALEAQLRALLPAAPLESADGHHAFYPLRPAAEPRITPAALLEPEVRPGPSTPFALNRTTQ